jgi:hypothetical protein
MQRPMNNSDSRTPTNNPIGISLRKGWMRVDDEHTNFFASLGNYICEKEGKTYEKKEIYLSLINRCHNHEVKHCIDICRPAFMVFRNNETSGEYDLTGKDIPCLRKWTYPAIHLNENGKLKTVECFNKPWYSLGPNTSAISKLKGKITSFYLNKTMKTCAPKFLFEVENGCIDSYSSKEDLDSDIEFYNSMKTLSGQHEMLTDDYHKRKLDTSVSYDHQVDNSDDCSKYYYSPPIKNMKMENKNNDDEVIQEVVVKEQGQGQEQESSRLDVNAPENEFPRTNIHGDDDTPTALDVTDLYLSGDF